MMNFWQTFRILLAVSGIVVLSIMASSSDYYVLQLGQHEPSCIRSGMIIGLLMLAPMFVHALYEMYIDNKVAEEMARRELEEEEK